MNVYVAYKKPDFGVAKRIATYLRQEGIMAWLDEWNMEPGVPMTEVMEHGVEAASAFLLILSKAAVDSIRESEGGLPFEVHIAEAKRMGESSFRIIGLKIEQCMPPLRLQNRIGRWIDLTDTTTFDGRLGELVRWLRNEKLGPPVRGA